MATFIIGLVILFGGGLLYGKFTEKVFGPDDRPTPAVEKNDGNEYVPMKKFKNSLIELLNVAGTGPIFGPIMKIRKGEAVAFMGPNGSGKSTLLKIINGLIFPDSGSYFFCGDEVTEKKMKDSVYAKSLHKRIGFIFQNSDAQLFNTTVYDEIAFGPRQMGMNVNNTAEKQYNKQKKDNVLLIEKGKRGFWKVVFGRTMIMAVFCLAQILAFFLLSAYVTRFFPAYTVLGFHDLIYDYYMLMNELSDLRDILSTDGTSNFIGYSNTKLDRYLNQMGFGIEEDTAVNKYKQIKQVINSDLPYYCVLYKTYGAIKAPSLEGTVSPSFNNYYYGCGNWKCKYEVTGSSSTSTNATDNAAANKTKSAAGNK